MHPPKKSNLRYFIEIAYNGKNYFGWQMQPEQNSVQEELEKAFSTILQKEIKVYGAGRTDTGVHAKQLFAHFDLEKIKNIEKLIFRLNSLMPNDISVKSIVPVTEDAHARFNALSREYEYLVTIKKDPFLLDFAYYIHHIPDVDLMNEAAQLLLSHTDFKCFSKNHSSVKTYNCLVETAEWRMEGNLLIFKIKADRFLRNMVRAIVGTLLDVGSRKNSKEDFKKILESRNRAEAGTSAPAHALYLTKIDYPKQLFL